MTDAGDIEEIKTHLNNMMTQLPEQMQSQEQTTEQPDQALVDQFDQTLNASEGTEAPWLPPDGQAWGYADRILTAWDSDGDRFLTQTELEAAGWDPKIAAGMIEALDDKSFLGANIHDNRENELNFDEIFYGLHREGMEGKKGLRIEDDGTITWEGLKPGEEPYTGHQFPDSETQGTKGI